MVAVTVSDGVHRQVHGGAPLGCVWCHHHVFPEGSQSGAGHRYGTGVPRAVHRRFFLERREIEGLAWVVTAIPRAMHHHPVSGSHLSNS